MLDDLGLEALLLLKALGAVLGPCFALWLGNGGCGKKNKKSVHCRDIVIESQGELYQKPHITDVASAEVEVHVLHLAGPTGRSSFSYALHGILTGDILTFNALDISRAKSSEGPLMFGPGNASGTNGSLDVDKWGASRGATLSEGNPLRSLGRSHDDGRKRQAG